MVRKTLLSLLLAIQVIALLILPAGAYAMMPVEGLGDTDEILAPADDVPEIEMECYIVTDGTEKVDIYADSGLKKKICIIVKEGDSILYYDGHEGSVYRVWFIDQNGETVKGYADFSHMEEPTKLKEDEAATMTIFGAENREVNGIFLNLFFTTVEYPPEETPVPTEVPVTAPPATEVPAQTDSPEAPATEEIVSTDTTPQPVLTAVVQTIQTPSPKATEEPVQATKQPANRPSETSQVQNGEVKSVTVKMPSDDDLKALGVNTDEPWYAKLLEGTGLFIIISVGAVIVILLIVLIIVKIKKKSKGSLLDR